MKSNTLLTKVAGAAVVALVVATTTLASPVDEPQYLGRNLTSWMSVIRDRNQDMISLAFEAIRWLGPEARAAVPDLTALIEAPFTPIRIGKDSQKVIASKLYEIEVRAGAIDALASIGESASPAALSLVRWALMPHVVVENIRNMDDQELFIELAIMDTEQRMRVAGAIPEFGRDASPVIAGLLISPDAEERKLGVAILSEHALPIASKLLSSPKCDERQLGFIILRDMDLVVAKIYLDWLQKTIVCDAN
ncbi:MAG: hypothetical protein AUI91_06640 [Acidobacteria bacterium 13_1_40CM_3_56_11]|nr:MAG: hypothetical protein AUI91_06640 [Acidobacteria bacterium 13_1_40CM_3_56_11]